MSLLTVQLKKVLVANYRLFGKLNIPDIRTREFNTHKLVWQQLSKELPCLFRSLAQFNKAKQLNSDQPTLEHFNLERRWKRKFEMELNRLFNQ